MELFGQIFEHSPHIAERTFARGLTDTEDSVQGLHDAFQQTVRGLSTEEKLSLLRAHPELAGSEAMSGTLTQASSGEQAAALAQVGHIVRARIEKRLTVPEAG